ncbi:UBP19, partial [Symbiodinium sp. KB8]
VCDRVGCSRPQPVSDYDSLEVCDPQSDQHVNRESEPEASCFWPVLVSERGILDLNPAIPKDNAELWQSLQGMWYKQKDNICVGEICGASISEASQVCCGTPSGSFRRSAPACIWAHKQLPSAFAHIARSPVCSVVGLGRPFLQLQAVAADALMVDLEGHVVVGRVRKDAQTMIHWSDGDVWLRK